MSIAVPTSSSDLGMYSTPTGSAPELSVVMPCLNEAETLGLCIQKVLRVFRQHGINGEVIVADNGSTDGSQQIAESTGARLVPVEDRGYGAALMGGVAAARGKYVVMGDADDSYDFGHIPIFLEKLRQGYDLVMGNRFQGGIQPHAMPPLHKFLGNPALTKVGRLFFHVPCGDIYCGLRGFNKSSYEALRLRTTGMEFATEMVIKASLLGLRITEVPTTLSPDGRSRPPHLRTWRDGWRTLRFFLLYSPRWLFLYPGAALMLVGTIVGAWLLMGPRHFGTVTLDYNSLLYASVCVALGFQSISFAAFTKIFAISEGLLPPDLRLDKAFRYFTLEVGIVLGGLLVFLGLGASVFAVWTWELHHFGPLNPSQTLRIVIPAALSLILGVQIIFSSFFVSVLGMRRK